MAAGHRGSAMVLQQNRQGESLKCSQPGLASRYFADGPHSRRFFHLQDPSYFSPSCAARGNPKLLLAPGNLLHPATKGLSGLQG